MTTPFSSIVGKGETGGTLLFSWRKYFNNRSKVPFYLISLISNIYLLLDLLRRKMTFCRLLWTVAKAVPSFDNPKRIDFEVNVSSEIKQSFVSICRVKVVRPFLHWKPNLRHAGEGSNALLFSSLTQIIFLNPNTFKCDGMAFVDFCIFGSITTSTNQFLLMPNGFNKVFRAILPPLSDLIKELIKSRIS